MDKNQLFAGRYRLISEQGRGSFGEVWLARDEQLDMEVAVKIYIALDDRGIEDFKKEYKTAYGLNHPNLLHAYHFDICDQRPFLVMTYCPESALSLIGNCNRETLWQFIKDVSSGLAYLHSLDIVHHDIKPGNILRTENGTFVITDFGISTKLRSTLRRNSTRSMNQMSSGGSLPYMGPEMFSAKPESVKATDIWALGVTLYEMITGDLPFFGQGGVMQLNGAAIPELEYEDTEIVKLVAACMSKNTWDRPTAEAIVAVAQERSFVQKPKEETRDAEKQDMGATVPLSNQNQSPDNSVGVKEPDTDVQDDELVHLHPEKPKKKKRTMLWVAIFLGIILMVILTVARNSSKKKVEVAYSNYCSLVEKTAKILGNEQLTAEKIVSLREDISLLKQMEDFYGKKDERYNQANALENTLDVCIDHDFHEYVKAAEASKNNVTKAENYYNAWIITDNESERYLGSERESAHEKYLSTVKKLNGLKQVTNIILYRTDMYEDRVDYEWQNGKWVITSDNKTISAANTDYLYCYMEVDGFKDIPSSEAEQYVKHKFYVKIINPDGTIKTGTSSPSGYSFSDTESTLSEKYYDTCNKLWLIGWGNYNKKYYTKGTYRYEVYNSGRKLFSIPVTFR